jgi:hypothetical protein
MSNPPSEIRDMEVRGYTSHNTPAFNHLRALSNLIDLSIVLFLFLITADFLRISPAPKLSLLFIFIATAVIYWIPQKKLYGVTLGERAWLLKPKNKEALSLAPFFFSLKERLYQRDYIAPLTTFSAILITALSILITATEFRSVILNHPNWLKTEEWKLKTFIPNPKDWTVSPFFYLLGGWPKSFLGKPVFYSLPYEVGPPTRFVGHVIAYWEHPYISVTFEGPKTPGLAANISELKECFVGGLYSIHCLLLREAALNRHINEIKNTKNLISWSMKWFNVENLLLTAQEAPQGIYLSAIGKNWTQDRFILINGNGTHQAIILRRPNNVRGQEAFQLLQQSIGSIRNFNELDSGKAWINRVLETTQLNELKVTPDSAPLSTQLGEIQQFLISKITVDPADFNSYFHLAGTSIMLAKAALDQRLQSKIALDNLESAQHFATDVAPADPRILQMQNLDAEMRKVLRY